MEVYKLEKSEEEVIVLPSEAGMQQEGGSSGNESCQEFRIYSRKVVSTLNGPIWSRCSIARVGNVYFPVCQFVKFNVKIYVCVPMKNCII